MEFMRAMLDLQAEFMMTDSRLRMVRVLPVPGGPYVRGRAGRAGGWTTGTGKGKGKGGNSPLPLVAHPSSVLRL